MAPTWSRNSTENTNKVLNNPDIQGYSISNEQSVQGSQQSSFAGISDPKILATLLATIAETAAGGDATQQAARAERQKQILDARAAAGDYSKEAAFYDAADLMAQQVRQAMEKNMPVINKQIQSSGSEGDSLAALLSQKLATDTAQASGALGAQQAVQYGQIQAGLQGVLELLTRPDYNRQETLAKLFEAAKISTSQGTSWGSSTKTSFGTETARNGQQLVDSEGNTIADTRRPY